MIDESLLWVAAFIVLATVFSCGVLFVHCVLTIIKDHSNDR